MDLILWRHAEAEDGTGKPDLERELTKHGRKQAEAMAQWLKPRLPARCRILASPAKRTLQTAEALGAKFETDKRVSTDASTRSVLAAAGWPDGEGAVLVVGHQPTLGEVAAELLGTGEGLGIPKGAIWWFANKGSGTETKLVAVMKPELAKN